LTLDQVDKLTKEFGLDFEEKKELERAVGQAEERLKQGRSRDYNNHNKDDEVSLVVAAYSNDYKR